MTRSATPEPRDIIVAPDFITAHEHAALLAWAKSMRGMLHENGPHRRYSEIRDLPRIDPAYTLVRLRLQAWLGLGDDIVPEPNIGWYLGMIGRGGAVHPHMDTTPPGTRHLRCNLFLETGKSGRPIIEDVAYDVPPRALLAFFPSERRHSSERVRGWRRRIVLSFGYTVAKGYRMPVG